MSKLPKISNPLKPFKDNAFVEFSLYLGTSENRKCFKNVICFSDRKFTEDAIEITGDAMPDTWLKPYRWEDLNILKECYYERDQRDDFGPRRPNLKSLKSFIMAFGFKRPSRLFMHIWHSRLPKTVAAKGLAQP